MTHPPSPWPHLHLRRLATMFMLSWCVFSLGCVEEPPTSPLREVFLSENADGDCELWIASCTHRPLEPDEKAQVEEAMGYIDIEDDECYQYYREFEALLDGGRIGVYDHDDGAAGWHHDDSDSGAGEWDGNDTDFNSNYLMGDVVEVAKTVIHEMRHHFGEYHTRWGQFSDGDDRCIKAGGAEPDPR